MVGSLTAMPRRPTEPPTPPAQLPPARMVTVPGRGEFFLRDSALAQPADGPAVLLLHGWVVSADLNWHGAYDALVDAGYRVLAIDHRGHGRGLRAPKRFRLTDCADDAAAVLRTLQIDPAIVVGYSMGGTIAQLMARDHRDVVSGVVYSGTCQHFQDPATAKTWKWMGVMGVAIGLAPRAFYRAGFRRQSIPAGATATWMLGEFMRHEARQVAEAGRELGRFDSRPWLHTVDVPTAVVLTARDTAVSPAKQRELAQASRATSVIEVELDHLELTARTDVYNPALLQAIGSLAEVRSVTGA
jgi:pimeloyl-ACP methyl ester carboxylesterase